MSRKKRRREHPPWWDEPGRKCRVFWTGRVSLLVHFPRFYGTPFILAIGPCGVRLCTPRDFFDAGCHWDPEMKKPFTQPSKQSRLIAPIDDIEVTLPTLAEFLAATAYEGDEPGTRRVSTLLIFGQDYMWKACLSDRQEGRCLWVAAPRFTELLPVLDEQLANADAVWRDDRAQGADQAKRQKPSNKT